MQWSDTALKVHMARLVELEYLLIHRGGRGQRYDYELLYDGRDDDQPLLMGLIDVEKLGYDAKRSGQKGRRPGRGQPQVRGQSDPAKPPQPLNGKGYRESGPVYAESTSAVV